MIWACRCVRGYILSRCVPIPTGVTISTPSYCLLKIMINSLMFRRVFGVLIFLAAVQGYAETTSPLVARGTLVASYPFRIVKGFMLVDILTYDTIVHPKVDEESDAFLQYAKSMRSYLIDLGASNEGSWLLDSTSTAVITEYKHVSIAA